LKSNTSSAAEAAGLRGLRTSPPIGRLPGRNRTKADILLYRHKTRIVAVKDYAPRPFLVRQILGRYLIRRETAAYRTAGTIDGLPRFLGRVGPFALALEWIEARPLATVDPRAVPHDCWERLAAIVDGLHARGVALADLHHRDVLIGTDETVHVVDLATAWVLGPRAGRLRRRLFTHFCDLDRVALARMRARFRGEDVEAAIAAVGRSPAAWHRRARWAKRWLGRLRGRR
jgi:hypothetical protein